MGTMALSITGLAASNPVPGTYIEVKFAQGEVAGDSTLKKVLFIGPKTASGSATIESQTYLLGSTQDAIDYFGRGSPIHRMMRRFTGINKTAVCYGLATTNPVTAAVAANGTITFAGVATAAANFTYTIAGDAIQIGVAKNDTATGSATDLKTEINLLTHLPVTAVSTGAVVTVTARVKGTNGNAIRHRGAMSKACGQTATVAAALLTGGATNEVYTNALATLLPSQYDYIVPAINAMSTSDVRTGALRTQVVSQADPASGIRQQIILAHGGTVAQAVTYTAQGTNGPNNSPRCQVLWQEAPEWEPMELAAAFAAVRYNKELDNPVYNYDGYGKGVNDNWSAPRQYSNGDWPTFAELQTAISGGLTPLAVAGGTKTYIVRSCTASTDVRVRDTSKVTCADKFAADLGARYESQWAGANLQDDPSNDNVQVAATVCTPNRLKGLTIKPLYIQYADNGWLDSAKTLAPVTGDYLTCTTGIDPVNATRINARIPIHVTAQLHQFAALVSENSAG